MGFLGWICIQAGCHGLQEGKISNKIYTADHGKVTLEQLIHQADLDQGQESLTASDPAPIPRYSYAKHLLAQRKAWPIETLKARDLPCDICIVCTFQFGNNHLYFAARAAMLSRPLLVYRYVGKQKEMWPRPVKDALLKMCFSTWQGV